MKAPVVLSFDVEEHHRIEAAVGYDCPPAMQRVYAERMEDATRRLLDQLAAAEDTKATFYVVAELAGTHPKLIRDIAAAGHEVGSHSYDHRRVHRFTPATFRDDLKRSVDAIQQVTGVPVFGFRAPTFSVTRKTAWAVDALIESGLRYDSSVFPVRHDRYGIPDAPRVPFWIEGSAGRLLELPLLTYRYLGQNLPVAGGGYFRLFPLSFMRAGIRQSGRQTPAAAMLYFHPWEFDPEQPKLPLGQLSKWRTYVGMRKSTGRLNRLLTRYCGRFRRAIDLVEELSASANPLPQFRLA